MRPCFLCLFLHQQNQRNGLFLGVPRMGYSPAGWTSSVPWTQRWKVVGRREWHMLGPSFRHLGPESRRAGAPQGARLLEVSQGSASVCSQPCLHRCLRVLCFLGTLLIVIGSQESSCPLPCLRMPTQANGKGIVQQSRAEFREALQTCCARP